MSSVQIYSRNFHIALICLLSLIFMPVQTYAEVSTTEKPTVKEILKANEDNSTKEPVAKTKAPYDRLDRGSPRSSVLSMTENMKQGDYSLASDFMDMRQAPINMRERAPELIRQLKIIGERTFWLGPENLSVEPTGHLNDGLPKYLDRVATIQTPDGPVDILMQRVPGDKKGVYIWKISSRTVANIPKLYQLYGYGEWGDKLSSVLPEISGLIIQPWQMVILAGLLLCAFTIAWMLTKIIVLFLKRKQSPRSLRIQRFIAGPVRFLIMVVIIRNYMYLIAPSLKLRAIIEAKTLYIVAIAWLCMGFINLFVGQLIDRMEQQGNTNGALVLRPAARAVKGIIILVAIMIWLDNMGFKISTLLAGLGVGSIAVALAAQKSIENLIGAITLYTAQPVKVGDFCRFGEILGTVEEIGLRATAVRTLDHTLIIIPNSNLSNVEIENISQRQKILYRHKIRLSSDSTPAQVREVLQNITVLFNTHENVDPVPARVRFKGFGEYALELETFVYLKTADYGQFLEIAEQLNLSIMDIIAQAGTRIAVPVESLHRLQDLHLDIKPA